MTETLIRQAVRTMPVVAVRAGDPVTTLGITTQLRRCGGITVAEAGSVRADIVVVAFGTVDDGAIERVRRLRENGSRVVAVVPAVDARALLPAVAAGVRAVIGRHELSVQRLLGVVRTVMAGGVDLPPTLVRQLVDRASSTSSARPAALNLAALSDRERDVLTLLALGLSTREVAEQLAYSERTIKNVLQELTTRLRLRNRTQAVAYAVRNGMI